MNFISLFCGCGGFDLGFVKAGFNCKAAFDIDKTAIENYSTYFTHNAKQYDLSQNISFGKLKDIDVVLAGPPCQGFSTAGKRKYDDPRNYLLLRAVEICLLINPKVFILENVNGVIAGQHKDYWDKAKEMLKPKYQIYELHVKTEEFGLAQVRKRRLLIAWQTNKNFNVSFPKEKPLTLKKVISRIGKNISNHAPKYFSEKSDLGLIAKRIKPGQ